MMRRGLALTVPLLLLAASEPAPPGRRVDVGGRKLHVQCNGSGTPAVLFLNGVPRASIHFSLVAAQVARFTAACVYDRAGEAWSEPAARPPNAAATLDEVDAMVRRVGGGDPVVLAGHSFGGLIARAYQARHARSVAGAVLIDSVADPPVFSVAGVSKPVTEFTAEDIVALGARMNERVRTATVPDPKIEPPFDRLPAALQPAHIWFLRKWQDYSLQIDQTVAIRYQVEMYRAAAGQSFGDAPLVAIARAKRETGSDAWIEQQQRLARLSTRGRLVRAVGSGHDIELEQPAVVVDAIRSVIEAVRAAR
jgi:pimeloyl-ACP methyl ester carboxylesterase